MKIFALCLLFVVSAYITQGKSRCQSKKKYYGCFYKPMLGKCLCKTRRGCENPFKHKSVTSCMKAASKFQGACKRFPCHHGICEVKKGGYGKFQCNCSKSGFYGKRCHKPCPKPSDMSLIWMEQFFTHKHWQSTPLSCIM